MFAVPQKLDLVDPGQFLLRGLLFAGETDRSREPCAASHERFSGFSCQFL